MALVQLQGGCDNTALTYTKLCYSFVHSLMKTVNYSQNVRYFNESFIHLGIHNQYEQATKNFPF